MKNHLIIDLSNLGFKDSLRRHKILKTAFVIAFCILLTNCSQQDEIASDPSTSPADLISGTYNGIGKLMPQGISLGNYNGCVEPTGWQNYLKSGQDVYATITKIDYHTVKLVLTGVPFSNTTVGVPFSNTTVNDIKITKNSDEITAESFLTYNLKTEFLSISGLTSKGSYIDGANTCLQGLPYYSGLDELSNGKYLYKTIGHVDFTGYNETVINP